MDTEGTIESVRINGLSVLSGLNLEKMCGLSFPGDRKAVQVSVKRGLTVHELRPSVILSDIIL